MATRFASSFSSLVLAGIVLSGAPLAAQVPAGPEFQVNTTTFQEQSFSAVATNNAGEFMAGWFNDQPQGPAFFDLLGQRFSPLGAPAGGEFTIPQVTSAYQHAVALAAGSRDRFIAVWHNTPSFFGPDKVSGRVFDSSGAVTAEFDIASSVGSLSSGPRVAAQPGGEFAVVWYGPLDGSLSGIAGRRMREDGTPAGGTFAVNTFTPGRQLRPAIAAAADGTFVVVWGSDGQDGSSYGVFGRRFAPSGAPIGGEFQVNVYTTGRQEFPVVAADAVGNFLVVWADNTQDGSASGVYARAYSAAGVPGSEFRLNVATTGYQGFPVVAADANGNFVIGWQESPVGGSDFNVVARRLRSGALGPEFRANSYTTGYQGLAALDGDAVGNFVVTWTSQDGSDRGVFGQRFGGLLPSALAVDPFPSGSSNGNGVLEAGELVTVEPAWRNVNGTAQTFAGGATAFTGPGAPGNPTYTIADAGANYGTAANGATVSCIAVADCYSVGTSVPTTRPASHWDAALREDIVPSAQGQSKSWSLHVGETFSDVPPTNAYYLEVETIVHHGITSGCGSGQYCPTLSTARQQMALMVLIAKEGWRYAPPPCTTPVFNDVPASSPYCRWIEELVRRGAVTGCGGGNFCPADPVTRQEMASIVLRTLDPALSPPPCAPPNIYADVPETNPFCPWIEELTNRGVVGGCAAGKYCPLVQVTREQMAVFLSGTFGLVLYGP